MNKGKLGDQMERLGLHLSRPNEEERVTPFTSKWADIITTIMKYQNAHAGRSPSNPLIAVEVGLSPGQVQYHLQQMERHGLLIDKEGWPRKLIVTATAKLAAQREQGPKVGEKVLATPKAKEEQLKEEEKEMETHPPHVNRSHADHSLARKKRETFIVNAKRFAEVLTDFYDTHGHAPLIKEIAPQLGYNVAKPVGISRIVKEMVARGWLHHKQGCQRDHVLTGLGRAVLFNEPIREVMHTDMPVHPQPAVQIRRAPTPTYAKPSNLPWPDLPRPSPDKLTDPYTMRSPVAQVMMPKPEPLPATTATPEWLSGIDTLDLVFELQARGFKVSR